MLSLARRLERVERPARSRDNPESRVLSRIQPGSAGVGNHGTVVGAKRRARIMHVDPGAPPPVREALAQIDVGADTARDQQSRVARVLHGSNAFCDERVDDRRLKRGGQIRARSLGQCAARLLFLALAALRFSGR